MNNPIHKRLKNIDSLRLLLFMIAICERMKINFGFFCKIAELEDDAKRYQNILDNVWQKLDNKKFVVDFELQLDKLGTIIPVLEKHDIYAVYPAVDACEGLANLLHALLTEKFMLYAVEISKLSLATIENMLQVRTGEKMGLEQLKEQPEIIEELDFQWLVYRMLKDLPQVSRDFVSNFKAELREIEVSNIGIGR